MPVTAAPTRAAEFRETLGQRLWVADGAMGTMLYSKGAFPNRSLDELNLSLPALVRDVHQEYIRAGAGLIKTNTFGANRRRLAIFGFADKVRLINRAGVRIAREAARDQAFVAASIGPLGVRLAPLGSATFDEARSIFREQIEALIEAGVDCLMLETFQDLDQVRAAVEAAREAAGPEIVVMAHLSIEDDGRLQDGTSIDKYARALDALPVDVIGLNCSSGPYALLPALRMLGAYTSKPLSILPNAGLPIPVDGRSVYPCSPEYMAGYAIRFVEAGARIVGGCCGTTPEHIRAIGEAVRESDPPPAPAIEVPEPSVAVQPMEKIPAADKSQLGAKLAAGTFVTLVEIPPPRGLDASREIAAARLCKDAGIDAVIISDGPRTGACLSAPVTCHLIQQEAWIEAALQVARAGAGELLGAYKLGIPNVICGPEEGLSTVVDHLNRGLDPGGNPLGSQTALLLGVDVNPSAYNLDDQLRRLEAQVKAGAEFAVTQPVFDPDVLEPFLKFGIPVIAEVRPLASFREADFLVNERRIFIPGHYLERMRRADDPAEGVAIAAELIQRLRPLVAGVRLSGLYQTAIETHRAAAAMER